MKILHLVPGSGGTFYCQNCLRDHLLIRSLRQHGHDVVLVPLYLPMYGGATAADTDVPLFFGGISVFVREKVPFLRRMPDWLDRLLNLPVLLRQAAAREGTTNAAGLGSMTLSMLEGRQGNQKQEFDRFLQWLSTQPKPDLIHISNALLLGFVPALREALNCPIVCSLQDEEPWVNTMNAPYDKLCWEAMARHGREVTHFVSTSHWYGERMIKQMDLRPEQHRVIYPGIDLPSEKPTFQSAEPPLVGYLSRLNPSQGFEEVVQAFIGLKQEEELASLRLRATGGATPADLSFMENMERRLSDAGFLGDTEITWDFQSAPDAAFFQGLSVMTAPVRGGEAFGMHIIEALSRAIPVVQPHVSAYPEIVEASGGGLLYDPEEAGAFEDALREVLTNPARSKEMGEAGYAYACEAFSVERMARDTIALYEEAYDASA
ncbi:MAG: glycosyltransferase family 4 protein [Candidatus Hydrogenedentes bacterium]|nr:glycosyltransferase family 4 protein [Candidatus Hydrogenedentota bacterium]